MISESNLSLVENLGCPVMPLQVLCDTIVLLSYLRAKANYSLVW